jgi:hypothetical protein
VRKTRPESRCADAEDVGGTRGTDEVDTRLEKQAVKERPSFVMMIFDHHGPRSSARYRYSRRRLRPQDTGRASVQHLMAFSYRKFGEKACYPACLAAPGPVGLVCITARSQAHTSDSRHRRRLSVTRVGVTQDQ